VHFRLFITGTDSFEELSPKIPLKGGASFDGRNHAYAMHSVQISFD